MRRKEANQFRLLNLRHDLGVQLLALYLLLVIPVLTATLIFDRVAGQQIRAEVRASDLSLARAIATETDLSLRDALDAVRNLAQYPAVIASNPQGMAAIFATLRDARPEVNLVYRLDSDGTMVYHYPEGPGSTVGQDFSFRDYFRAR
jgi:hypothetical protein